MTDYTAIISGAGPAGLAAAVLLARDGVKTAVVAPSPNVDPRTTALMQPAMNLLKFIGLWPELEPVSSPLRRLHIIDDTGNLVTAPRVEFAAAEMGLEEFGWNIPVANLVAALKARAEQLGVSIISGSSCKTTIAPDAITLELEDGRALSARILLVADGASSKLRSALGITVETERFNQTAIATSFEHSAPHDFISTEFHKSAGPFTTVPLPGNRSSLVWMERPARAEDLMALPDKDFATEVQIESHGFLGKVRAIGPRKTFPVQSQRATRFSTERALLIGEAAHALPPIGAQGLNLSLRDAAQAADLIIGASDPGAKAVTSEYDTLRRADVVPRQLTTALLNKSLLADFLPLHVARAGALAAVSKIGPLRQLVMQYGLKPAGNLPFAMRRPAGLQ